MAVATLSFKHPKHDLGSCPTCSVSNYPFPYVRGRFFGYQDSQEVGECLCLIKHLPCEPKDLSSVPRNHIGKAEYDAMTLQSLY